MPARPQSPPPVWFLGPKSEHRQTWADLLDHVFSDYAYWRRNYWPTDPALSSRQSWEEHADWLHDLRDQLDLLLSHLKADFPFFHPRYLAHMTSEQTLPAVLGYFAGMLYNPNNVSVEGAPVTTSHELEVASLVAEMLGLDTDRAWGHITSGGTLATLEALWVARHVQLVPFSLKDELCGHPSWKDLEVGRRDPVPLAGLDPEDLLALPPSDAAALPSELAGQLGDDGDRLVTRAILENPARGGAQAFGKQPVAFASEAVHYSIKKACNILGISLELVPLTQDLRLDRDELKMKLEEVVHDERRYVAAVIATVGTTEFGAVDDVEGLIELRDKLQSKDEESVSFWIHIDAAWGGYFASMLRGKRNEGSHPWPANTEALRSALEAIKHADSVTVDPHKLGYLPYPAGIVVFRDRRAPALVQEEATYVGESVGTAAAATSNPKLEAIGPFALEGSKPGAAAAACWLAHKTIPLVWNKHGLIVESTLRAARDLAAKIEGSTSDPSFELVLVSQPDTNIVCYLVVPTWIPDGCPTLAHVNSVNEEIHKRLGKPSEPREVAKKPSVPAAADSPPKVPPATPHAHPFFISRTVLRKPPYTWSSVEPLFQRPGPLKRLAVKEKDFTEQGIVILRSTVMNPHYRQAPPGSSVGRERDYLMDFVKQLTAVAADVASSPS
jgi:glutamate/tyrosine decarboxylase-like PLP-dependent enzyme